MPKPQPAPAKPAEILWFAWDWRDPSRFDPALLRSLGVTGVLALAHPLQYDPQNRKLSLNELRANAAEIQGRAGTLAVWWSFSVVQQAGALGAGAPARTFCDLKDPAQRTQVLNNYASIGRVAKEYGFPAVALDFEAYGVTQPYLYPDAGNPRTFGSDLVKALRRDNPGLRVAGFCPLSFNTAAPGWRPFVRGFYEAAGPSGVFFNEDTYGLSRTNVKQALAHTQDLTHAAIPACGWYPEGHVEASAVPGYVASAAANVRAATAGGRPLMIYREGAVLTQPEPSRALRGVLAGGG